jgi:hypothetical protein
MASMRLGAEGPLCWRRASGYLNPMDQGNQVESHVSNYQLFENQVGEMKWAESGVLTT